MTGNALVKLISLLNKKAILTDKEAVELLDDILDKASQQKAILDRMKKQ